MATVCKHGIVRYVTLKWSNVLDFPPCVSKLSHGIFGHLPDYMRQTERAKTTISKYELLKAHLLNLPFSPCSGFFLSIYILPSGCYLLSTWQYYIFISNKQNHEN